MPQKGQERPENGLEDPKSSQLLHSEHPQNRKVTAHRLPRAAKRLPSRGTEPNKEKGKKNIERNKQSAKTNTKKKKIKVFSTLSVHTLQV